MTTGPVWYIDSEAGINTLYNQGLISTEEAEDLRKLQSGSDLTFLYESSGQGRVSFLDEIEWHPIKDILNG